MLRSRRDGNREPGQILVLFALSLVVILVFASIVVDVGMLRNNRQILVNALDAAALAGGTKLPVDGSVPNAANEATTLIDSTIQANYPGLPTSAYKISYRCLITASNGQPDLTQVTGGVCNPSNALGHTPTAADFVGTGSDRFSTCDPGLGDKCNVVVITGSATTQYGLGGVVGITSGSTGAVQSAACNGPCGPNTGPADIVLIMDRTLSMSGNGPNTDIGAIQGGADALLSALNPAYHRIALGTIGPSVTGTASCPNQSSAWKNTQVLATGQSNINDFTTVIKWVPVGFSGTDSVTSPAPVTFNEMYSTLNPSPPPPPASARLTWTGSTIWKAISCLTSFTGGTNLDTPIAMARAYLASNGRPNVKKVIILETDGTPQAGDGSAHYTCAAASATAAAARAAGIEIFTFGYGVGSAKCPTKSGHVCDGSTGNNSNETTGWSCQPATTLLMDMATPDTDALVKHFVNQPKGTDVSAAFKGIGDAIAKGGLHLVQSSLTPVFTSRAPSSGDCDSTTSVVTIRGQFFTAATDVAFGTKSAGFNVVNDTTITATAPTGTAGTQVHITVTTPGGTTATGASDLYTFNAHPPAVCP
jgi:Flp pilus assembly protein TadG